MSTGTLVRNMSYMENESLENVKIDMSFTKSIEEFNVLSDFDNMKSLSVQVDGDHFAANQMNRISGWLERRLPNVTVRTSTY